MIHILNGDALTNFFPENLGGDRLIAREALIEGPVLATDMNSFFKIRASYIHSVYGETESSYQERVRSEFEKIRNLAKEVEINLWFEEDLFCQVNLWFVLFLLSETNRDKQQIYLVRPLPHSRFSFGNLSTTELETCFENRILLQNREKLSQLWDNYSHQNWDKLKSLSDELNENYPFINESVTAHLDRLETADFQGKPKQVLHEIKNQLQTEAFEPIFSEFCKRLPIYGFGDVQVKRMLEELRNRIDTTNENAGAKPRQNWAAQFKKMHENGDDKLLMPDVFEDEE
jgi:hypothetical protein